MSRIPNVIVAAIGATGLLVLAACADPGGTTAPTTSAAAARAALVAGAGDGLVTIRDACDPTTFNAALQNPSACVRAGGVRFEKFLAELGERQQVGGWRFAPPTVEMAEGGTLVAVNRGGEVHTFTEVEEFGGGINATLNELSGNPVAAPECLALRSVDFLAAGATQSETEDEAGDEHYQCCIHPWMRTTVHVRTD